LRSNPQELGTDGERMAIWSCSSNVANTVGLVYRDKAIICATFCHELLMDLGESTAVKDAQETFRFANPELTDNEFPDSSAKPHINGPRPAFRLFFLFLNSPKA
jgi:hypothetical protein